MFHLFCLIRLTSLLLILAGTIGENLFRKCLHLLLLGLIILWADFCRFIVSRILIGGNSVMEQNELKTKKVLLIYTFIKLYYGPFTNDAMLFRGDGSRLPLPLCLWKSLFGCSLNNRSKLIFLLTPSPRQWKSLFSKICIKII